MAYGLMFMFASPVSFMLILIGLGICFLSRNPLLLMLGVGIFGLGKFSIWPASMCEYSEILLEESLTQVSSLFVSVNSLGSFLASFSIGVIAAVSGNSFSKVSPADWNNCNYCNRFGLVNL